MAELQVEVVSVEEKIWSGEASILIARTTEGELAVLPGHTPLLGELVDPGEVRVRTTEGEHTWTVHGGFLSVTAEGVSVLAETVSSPDGAPAGQY
ncbi:F-type H+-transporting ATPase subunit epsilon [Cryptosporangium aurantiacum]|uniref:ATP synthase epsilon chain n=1 Tax=Cryptosporangium aurantiacum TaxID=134849 RepID=A0A1M7H9R6_9ACTN|nr:F0F1 ATP synthase subunit epsilon [Cryptosporangium aurantiacum]SHM25160.1 F-type H+-transporting ATPase subunit epsilon [Cryptosporangium aurantiacum]